MKSVLSGYITQYSIDPIVDLSSPIKDTSQGHLWTQNPVSQLTTNVVVAHAHLSDSAVISQELLASQEIPQPIVADASLANPMEATTTPTTTENAGETRNEEPTATQENATIAETPLIATAAAETEATTTGATFVPLASNATETEAEKEKRAKLADLIHCTETMLSRDESDNESETTKYRKDMEYHDTFWAKADGLYQNYMCAESDDDDTVTMARTHLCEKYDERVEELELRKTQLEARQQVPKPVAITQAPTDTEGNPDPETPPTATFTDTTASVGTGLTVPPEIRNAPEDEAAASIAQATGVAKKPEVHSVNLIEAAYYVLTRKTNRIESALLKYERDMKHFQKYWSENGEYYPLMISDSEDDQDKVHARTNLRLQYHEKKNELEQTRLRLEPGDLDKKPKTKSYNKHT